MTHSFDIGYFGPHTPALANNLPSALKHPAVVDEALCQDSDNNCIAGPYKHMPYPTLRCSGLGVVPKNNGSYRLIYHLSGPVGNSINDYIPGYFLEVFGRGAK